MTEDTFRRAVVNSVDRAASCARKIRKAAIPIIKQEMQMNDKQASAMYKRLLGD